MILALVIVGQELLDTVGIKLRRFHERSDSLLLEFFLSFSPTLLSILVLVASFFSLSSASRASSKKNILGSFRLVQLLLHLRKLFLASPNARRQNFNLSKLNIKSLLSVQLISTSSIHCVVQSMGIASELK